MTREEEKAKESKKHYCDDINCYHAFLHGAEWADEHPNLERLWHDASEIPQAGIEVIIQFGQKMYDGWHLTFNLPQYDEVKWKEWCERQEIVRWAYIIDLLPKGGKK